MLAFKRVIRAVPMVGILGGIVEGPAIASRSESEPEVNLWADSVGEALTQLGLVLTLAIVTRVVIGLLSGLSATLR